MGLLALAAVVASLVVVPDERAGPFRFYPAGHPAAYHDAVRSFGAPSRRGVDGNLCACRWPRLGLELGFASDDHPCRRGSLAHSAWYGATFTSRRWRTRRGLRVGDSLARLRLLYPHARRARRPARWVLARRRVQELDFEILTAKVRRGRVTSLSALPSYVY